MASVVMLGIANFYCYAECFYAECHYALCHYAECYGANFMIYKREIYAQSSFMLCLWYSGLYYKHATIMILQS
jgi:hypothetical protein